MDLGRREIIALLVSLVAIPVAYLGLSDHNSRNEATRTPTNRPGLSNNSSVRSDTEGLPFVVVDPQPAKNSVVIEKVGVPQQSWISVLKEGEDGRPDLKDPVGYKMISEGISRDITIELDTELSGTYFFVALHRDDPKNGEFDIPDGDYKYGLRGEGSGNFVMTIRRTAG